MSKKLITTLNLCSDEKLLTLYHKSTYKPTIDEIKEFRKETGLPLLHCKYSLAITDGDWKDARYLSIFGELPR